MLETEDPFDMLQPEAVDTMEENISPRFSRQSCSTPSQRGATPKAVATPNFMQYNGVPPGITPHVISSSETLGFVIHQRPGNTTVCCKSISRHHVIAEATKATGVVMATQMQEIANSSRNLEKSKIKVHLKLFIEKMAYQREKDRRIYENQNIANDNARLTISKETEMLSCLVQLSSILSIIDILN